MPSPFPGMDPFIEGQRWPDFHLRILAQVSEQLVSSLRPRYTVIAEERMYLEHETQVQSRHVRPDLVAAQSDDSRKHIGPTPSTAILRQPAEITLPIPEEVTERYLTIRDRETRDVVTIIEVLSPANKRDGSDGRAQYLAKRDHIFVTMTNLVEVDLLRGGVRLPANQPPPAADYYAIVSCGRKRPAAQAYHWTIRDSLPIIPIPLTGRDSDVSLDLQAAFVSVYDGGGYDYSLDYSGLIEPPLPTADTSWTRDILNSRD